MIVVWVGVWLTMKLHNEAIVLFELEKNNSASLCLYYNQKACHCSFLYRSLAVCALDVDQPAVHISGLSFS